MVNDAAADPRRSATLVLAPPSPIPVGYSRMTLRDTSSDTPRLEGPGSWARTESLWPSAIAMSESDRIVILTLLDRYTAPIRAV